MYVNNVKFNKRRGYKNRTTVHKREVRVASATTYEEDTRPPSAYWYTKERNAPHIAGKSSRYRWNNYARYRSILTTLPAGDLRAVAKCAEVILGKKVLELFNAPVGKSFSGKNLKVSGVLFDVMGASATKATSILETKWELDPEGNKVKSTRIKLEDLWAKRKYIGTHFSQFTAYGNRTIASFCKKPKQKRGEDLPYAKFTRNWISW